MLRILWIGVLCVWCVNCENMRSIVVGNRLQSKNDTKSDEIQIESDVDGNSRTTRQLNPGGWTPIAANWRPLPRSALNTWWALPWSFENGQSLVRIQPPSPYWQDYRHPEHEAYHHQHEHGHHHHHHGDHHKSPYPGRYPGMGMYIAQNLGAVHIAPLPGHIGTVIASNMQPALGSFPPNPFFGSFPPFGPGMSVDVAPPPLAAVPAIPPSPPPAARQPPVPVLPTPLPRTW